MGSSRLVQNQSCLLELLDKLSLNSLDTDSATCEYLEFGALIKIEVMNHEDEQDDNSNNSFENAAFTTV